MIKSAKHGAIVAAAIILLTGVARAQTSVAKLTAADYFEINNLYSDYSIAHDTANGPMRVATWTPDGTLNEQFYNKDTKSWRNIRDPETMDSVLKRTNAFPASDLPKADMIIQTNIHIRPTADGATATCYAYIFRGKRDANGGLVRDLAYYVDTLVKTPQGWKFKTRGILTW